jgi:hypothetical protein
LAPVIVHGLYDTILFGTSVLVEKYIKISESLAGLISIMFTALFIYFCFKMWKFGSLKIKQHIANDKVTRLYDN